MAQLSQCIYLSRSLIAPHSVDLLDIERSALRNNPELGISGFLYVDATFFVQLLEGPTQALAELLSTLRRDRRHIGMLILRERPLEARRFAEWPMMIFDGCASAQSQRKIFGADELLAADRGSATQLLHRIDTLTPSGTAL